MNKTTLCADLSSLLMDSADKFSNDELDGFLNAAALDLSRVKPLVEHAILTIEADTSNYSAPAGIVRVMTPFWGLYQSRVTKPWESDWPGQLPRLTLDGPTLYLMPAPTAGQISLLGSDYEYSYVAPWVIGASDDDTNVPDKYHDLILIRALVSAMIALSNRNLTKPVKLGSCGGQPACNGTAAGLATEYMDLFERMAA